MKADPYGFTVPIDTRLQALQLLGGVFSSLGAGIDTHGLLERGFRLCQELDGLRLLALVLRLAGLGLKEDASVEMARLEIGILLEHHLDLPNGLVMMLGVKKRNREVGAHARVAGLLLPGGPVDLRRGFEVLRPARGIVLPEGGDALIVEAVGAGDQF